MQKVRDLWQQKDLGNFKKSYTVINLGQTMTYKTANVFISNQT